MNEKYIYWGNVINFPYNQQQIYSDHIISRHSNNIPNNLSLLKNFPIAHFVVNYCSGCAYYLSKIAINVVVNNPEKFKIFPQNNDELKKYLINNSYFSHDLSIFEDVAIGHILYLNNIIPVNIKLDDFAKWI